MALHHSDLGRVRAAVKASLHDHWRVVFIEGVVLVLLGAGAMVLPSLATFAVELVLGWALLVSGVVGLISTFRMRGAPGAGWSLFSAVLAVAAGCVLLVWPLSGVFSLTFLVTAFLALEGIASVMLALGLRRGFAGRWGMLLLSGIVDLVLAGTIFAGLPGTSVWAIGLLVGVNLVFGGATLISMALHARNLVPSFPPVRAARF